MVSADWSALVTARSAEKADTSLFILLLTSWLRDCWVGCCRCFVRGAVVRCMSWWHLHCRIVHTQRASVQRRETRSKSYAVGWLGLNTATSTCSCPGNCCKLPVAEPACGTAHALAAVTSTLLLRRCAYALFRGHQFRQVDTDR